MSVPMTRDEIDDAISAAAYQFVHFRYMGCPKNRIPGVKALRYFWKNGDSFQRVSIYGAVSVWLLCEKGKSRTVPNDVIHWREYKRLGEKHPNENEFKWAAEHAL